MEHEWKYRTGDDWFYNIKYECDGCNTVVRSCKVIADWDKAMQELDIPADCKLSSIKNIIDE